MAKIQRTHFILSMAAISMLVARAPARAAGHFPAADMIASELKMSLSLPTTASDQAAHSKWDRLFEGVGNKVTFGVNLHGPTPYSRNNAEAFAPASNSKLFTTAIALRNFGADATFSTTLAWNDVATGETNGVEGEITNVTLTGSGDPSWGLPALGESLTSRIDAIVAALQTAGVKSIRGRIRVESADPRWDAQSYPEGWTDSDHVDCDGALPQSFNLALNCATLVIKNTKKAAWLESGVPTAFTLDLRRADKTSLSITTQKSEADGGVALIVSGTIARSATQVKARLPVYDVKAWVRNLLIDSAKRHSITIEAQSVLPTAIGGIHQLDFESPALREILKPFLKNSDNLIGEALLRGVASRFGAGEEKSLVAAGQRILKDFVAELGGQAAKAAQVAPQPGFYAQDVVLYDGSGLSRESRVTSDAMMALLLDLRAEADFQAVWDALPIAGVDGTLASRMKGTAAEGELRAKTGTLSGVYNLSGFVPRRAADGTVNEFVPFVILTRTSASDGERVAHKLEDQVGAELAKELSSRAR